MVRLEDRGFPRARAPPPAGGIVVLPNIRELSTVYTDHHEREAPMKAGVTASVRVTTAMNPDIGEVQVVRLANQRPARGPAPTAAGAVGILLLIFQEAPRKVTGQYTREAPL